MINAINREVPTYIEGLGNIKPYEKFRDKHNIKDLKRFKNLQVFPNRAKLAKTISAAIERMELKDGMTVSFHHHFRNGDSIVNIVMDAIAELGIKDITVAASSLTDVHAPLIQHIKNGVIRRIETSGVRGPLADEISAGIMDLPIIIRSHGGRARAIESGDIKIDVAFLGVPSCDVYGNSNGFSGPSACGSLGYAKVDAQHAKRVVMITDNLVACPNIPFSIPQYQVDCIVVVDKVGDASKIMSGATRFTKNPKDLLIAKTAADVIECSGYFEDGFSMQTGSGGASLAATRFLRDKMLAKDIRASFALGGITGQIVKLHEEGLIEKLLDVQSFDLDAVKSLKENPMHYEIDASYYANPDKLGSAVNQLDVVVLSALEIDTNFNINVITGSDGVIRGASGGHCDTAAGACVSIVVAPLIRGRMPSIIDRVHTVITPGETVDVVVTDQGIAINPLRKDLYDRLKSARLPLFDIHELREKAEKVVGKPAPIPVEDKIVGIVDYRDGTAIDVIRKVKKENFFY